MINIFIQSLFIEQVVLSPGTFGTAALHLVVAPDLVS